MNDLISRYAAIDAMCDACETVQAVCAHYPCKRYFALNAIPAAQPERESAEWVENDNGTCSCSKCQSWIPKEQRYYARFCLHCGSKMAKLEPYKEEK